jgi:selenocysteine lyase/cysteine desulfurase
VHLVPHKSVDVRVLGCDVLATSPYKWYGPHAGVLCVEPELLDSLPIAKVRPAADRGPGRFETGTPNFESIAAVEAAARFLLEEGMERVSADEMELFAPLLDGLQAIDGVRVWGPSGLAGRTPTAAFTVRGHTPSEVADVLAAERIATWAGHSYAVEVVQRLGLANSGGVVRAGVVRYIEPDDVARLLGVVERLSR